MANNQETKTKSLAQALAELPPLEESTPLQALKRANLILRSIEYYIEHNAIGQFPNHNKTVKQCEEENAAENVEATENAENKE